jgi:hypothetical protein
MILLLSILNSILLYDNKLGLNVILFIIPLLLFLVKSLKNKIKNKKGLFFIIPILLLSASYFIYDNIFFKMLNCITISILLILMYIYSIKPTFKINEVMYDIINLLLEPLTCIGKFYKNIFNKIKIPNKSKIDKKKLKSIIIVIPIVLIIILMLCSADEMFESIFENVFNIFEFFPTEKLIGRILVITIIFTYLGATIYYLHNKYENAYRSNGKEIKLEEYTVKLLLTILNTIYLLFDFIQIRSLIFHHVSTNINYAEYARSGFFQLMFISLINVILLLISHKQNTKYNKIMSLIMVLFTFAIICSSFYRMYMYESAYGYTLLRLLVYVTLITLTILLIPTICYILGSNIKILKHYIVIILTIYTILSLIPVNYFIAYNNINRYYKTGKIDIEYLQNYSTDNIPLLVDLYNKTDDYKIKTELKYYFEEIEQNNKIRDFREYNISKHSALKSIKNNTNIVKNSISHN